MVERSDRGLIVELGPLLSRRKREREEAEMEAWSWAAGGCHGEREAAEMGNGKLGKRNLKFSIYT